MTATIRLTMAQALTRYLSRQMAEIDGQRLPIFGGVWAIFGHGNVAGLGEALWQERERLPTFRAHNEQAMAHAAIAYAKADHEKDYGPDLALAARQNLRSPRETISASEQVEARHVDGVDTAARHGVEQQPPSQQRDARGQEDELSPRTANLEVEHRRLRSDAVKLRGRREHLQRLRNQMEAMQHDINSGVEGDAQVEAAQHI